MDSLRYSSCPNLSEHLAQADRSHVVEVVTARHFGGQFDYLVLKPLRAGALLPYG